MGDKRKEMVGERVGLLTVVNYSHTKRTAFWLCQCDCGNLTIVRGDKLRKHLTRSCGCLSSKNRGLLPTKEYVSKEYRTWSNIKRRCYQPNYISYHWYGGRGIKVCNRWRNSFRAFLKDMGRAPTSKHTIDRIDNDGDYTPENCRWVTMRRQARNKGSNVYVTIEGKRLCVADWIDILELNGKLVYKRMDRGWKPKDALLIPVGSVAKYHK